MNNIIVYCETDNGALCDVSLELMTKARDLAGSLSCNVEALLIGHNVAGLADTLYKYGASVVHLADDPRLEFYRTLPYAALTIALFKEQKPQIALFGATSVGRDLAPRVSSALHSGLTADCTSLEIGDHQDKEKEYKNLLYQIRPAFGGNIIATIINPECRPQMATVREGVMKKEALEAAVSGTISRMDVNSILKESDFVVQILEREIEEKKIDIKGAQIIVAGGFGVGSKENFQLIYDLAKVLGGEVGASRAAVDAGFVEHARQIGQTGVTVRPKLFIACGISGQIQHTAGMDGSSMIISINNDPEAPIHKIADYAIVGDLNEVIPKIIKSYKQNSK
ncbi:MAG: electron transfer flavoprotein subunit alpha/FixB family protein [Bacteroidales bacterium]|nr:electron transfer flavoprotein subunit alpha/FixB family protein [Bacteroidales bacterium]MBO7256108.1 electron transfer flavoprotein subunit alpha/FixB family protein [Bacteroidales bacterium]MBO7283846.1 electron transfer flavoprotein subunit alpha/FixB family protein [Bacteroidales bacterium]MBO7323731.1 electron transfer flavoprotein subunit alpha/FixB family protein [Bacteroidales bacterium]MBQ5882502.1 electron transfer flavoprotein subunit alpha/FixB family protein [Bacteroidales bact